MHAEGRYINTTMAKSIYLISFKRQLTVMSVMSIYLYINRLDYYDQFTVSLVLYRQNVAILYKTTI